ncbi:MAG: hypothetical protein KDA37_03870, partial [Planctomycetales bacterium]|nr:hypothetical protein [Planctomycetales bacterium]
MAVLRVLTLSLLTPMLAPLVLANDWEDPAVIGRNKLPPRATFYRFDTPDAAKSGWELASEAVRDYADKAKETGQGVGDALVSGFRGAEDAVGEFVKTGKLGMRDLVTSILADLAKVSIRRFVLAPIANALGGV